MLWRRAVVSGSQTTRYVSTQIQMWLRRGLYTGGRASDRLGGCRLDWAACTTWLVGFRSQGKHLFTCPAGPPISAQGSRPLSLHPPRFARRDLTTYTLQTITSGNPPHAPTVHAMHPNRAASPQPPFWTPSTRRSRRPLRPRLLPPDAPDGIHARLCLSEL